jgi:hypothetical protein
MFLDQSTKRVVPEHLTFKRKDQDELDKQESLIAKVIKMIPRSAIGLKMNELLVVEFYSRQA